MANPEDRTQEWLNRTQELRRTPALRGGVVPDRQARRHTSAAVTVMALALLALVALGPRLRPAGRERLPAETEAAVRTSGPGASAPVRAARPAFPEGREGRVSLPPPAWLSPVYGTVATAPGRRMLPPGSVSPPVPIALDGPLSLPPQGSAAGVFLPILNPPRPSADLVGR